MKAKVMDGRCVKNKSVQVLHRDAAGHVHLQDHL